LNKIGKDASLYLTASITSFGISFLALPIYTRLLSPKEFGAVILFMMIGKMIFGFMDLSLHAANYKFFFDQKKGDITNNYRSLYSSNFFFLLIFFLVVIGIVYFLKSSFFINLDIEYLTKQNLILAITYGFFDYIILYKTTQLTAEKRAKFFSFIVIFNSLLNLGLSIFLINSLPDALDGRIYGIIVSQSITILILLYFLKNLFITKLSINKLVKSIKFSSPYYPQMLLGLSQSYLDKTLLSQLKGASSVGYYSLGVNFTIVLKTIMDSVEKAWAPIFFEKAHENTNKSKNLIVDSFNFLAFSYMFIGLFIIYFSEEAIKVLTTREYYSAIEIVPIYMFFYFFAIYGYLSNAQLTITEKLKYILPGSILSAIVNILLNIMLIPKFGTLGAALASCFSALISQSLLFYYGNKFFRLPLKFNKILGIYFLLFIYTGIYYYIISIEIQFLLKIILKLFLLSSFFCFGVSLDFISIKKLKRLIKIK
jgi:O-antigen/teichoic acid export membrane protein